MSQLEIVIRAVLLLLPAAMVGLGGVFAYRWRHAFYLARAILIVTACALLTSSAFAYYYDLPLLFWVWQLLIALPCMAFSLSCVTTVTRLRMAIVSPRRWEFVLLAISPLFLAGAVWQLNIMTTPVVDDIQPSPKRSLITRQAKESAYTDRGRRVLLFELIPESMASFDVAGDDGLVVSGTPAPYRSIRLTEANGHSNCVGWVFAGAHHLMLCSDVEKVLEDNGYMQTQAPRVGDLVIYRDDSHLVTHAGRVAYLLNEDQPLIESKWGYQGVFLHLPQGSPFGMNWTFYRSSRSNQHLLLTTPPVLDADPDPAADAPP